MKHGRGKHLQALLTRKKPFLISLFSLSFKVFEKFKTKANENEGKDDGAQVTEFFVFFNSRSVEKGGVTARDGGEANI